MPGVPVWTSTECCGASRGEGGRAFVGLSDRAVTGSIQDYAETVVTVDVDSAGKLRDPARVRRLMVALARSIGTEVTISTLARDETSLSRDAVREYLDALSRIFVIEDQPAWSAHLRSSATLRQEPKRHFCEPSLALALVGGDASALKRDLGYAGQLFESLVVHDLRVLSQPLGGSVFHARISAGREIDAIIQMRDGSWAGFEVKLGASSETLDAAAESLLAFTRNIEGDRQPILNGDHSDRGFVSPHRRGQRRRDRLSRSIATAWRRRRFNERGSPVRRSADGKRHAHQSPGGAGFLDPV